MRTWAYSISPWEACLVRSRSNCSTSPLFAGLVPESAAVQRSLKRSKPHAALAGLVEGSTSASMPTLYSRYFLYRRPAVAPLQTTRLMGAALIMRSIRTGTTFLMLASLEPLMSHSWITSHRAMPQESSKRFFSGMVSGAGALAYAANIRQKRFCGLP